MRGKVAIMNTQVESVGVCLLSVLVYVTYLCETIYEKNNCITYKNYKNIGRGLH